MKRTPLYNEHIKLKGKMVEFGGWEMPVLYSGVIDEHRTVRTSAGIFDVSHMGEFEITGSDALSFTQYLTTNDISKLADGQAVYSILCNERGTIVDDIIVYRFNAEHILLVVNAGNIEKDWEWVNGRLKSATPTNLGSQTLVWQCEIKNRSDDFALIALQGPRSAEILSKLAVFDIKQFHFAKISVTGANDCIIARTGYTGEDGFEIFCPSHSSPKTWEAILETGKPLGLKPAGLGARDTLRLEMKYSLYGHEINDGTNPLEAGLGWVVKLNKGCDFIGKAALEKIKAEGLKRKCVGFQMIDAGIPRQGYKIITKDEGRGTRDEIGLVCSGTMSPSLNKAIGTGYVPISESGIGTKIFIDIRGAMRLAEIVETPFYKRR